MTQPSNLPAPTGLPLVVSIDVDEHLYDPYGRVQQGGDYHTSSSLASALYDVGCRVRRLAQSL